MAANKPKKENVMTPIFRVSYPVVFQPRRMDERSDLKYSICMLFKKGEDLSKLKASVQACVLAKYGSKDQVPANFRNPFRDQGEKKGAQGYEAGAIFINATSKQRPGIVDQNVQPIIDESEFYAGCWARATIRPFCYDTAGNRGVSFGLQNIQKMDDGEPLGGHTRPEMDFEPIESPLLGGSTEDSAAKIENAADIFN